VDQVVPDAELCEMYEPRLVQVDAFARRIDEIQVHEAWKRLHAVAAEEGLIAIGYERPIGGLFPSFSRFALVVVVLVVVLPSNTTKRSQSIVSVLEALSLQSRLDRCLSPRND